MKFLILALLLAVSTQQTVYSQLSCSRLNCAYMKLWCFEDKNDTTCAEYANQVITDCGLESIEQFDKQIFEGKDFDSPAGFNAEQQCVINAAETSDKEAFKYYGKCLQECTEFIAESNSLVGLQEAGIIAAKDEYAACREDEDCLTALQTIDETEKCKACDFLPEKPEIWNLPLTYSEANCFSDCYNETNTDNEKLQAFFIANQHLLDGVEFQEEWIDDDDYIEDNGHKKLFEVIIAFFIKLFSWLFK